MIQVDSKGILWASSPTGAIRLNPETGGYTAYKSVTPQGNPYGITVDSEDNAWFAQLSGDRVGKVDGRTGEVSEVVVSPLEVTAKDREIGERITASLPAQFKDIRFSAPLYMKGPRRLGADRKGDTVWVGEHWGGRLAKIDIHTMKLTEYKLPNEFCNPYSVTVGKNHMVWVAPENENRLIKFNPYTEKFTEYPLPSIGTSIRFIDVDESTDPPTLWVPYELINKIARVQFRTSTAR